MGYALATDTDWVTCSWQCHKDRNPPSSEPGTDLGAGYGSPVYAIESGTVTYIKTTNSGAMGRVVEYALDDGRTTRSLHLSQVWVGVGQRVSRGQQIAVSGASGYDNDWYYGPHDHQTLWPGAAWTAPTIDYMLYVGSEPAPEPPATPESTEVTMLLVKNVATGHAYTVGQRFLHHCSSEGEANVCANLYNEGVSWKKGSNKWINLEENYFNHLLKANGIPLDAKDWVLGSKTWHEGNLLESPLHDTVWTATDIWGGNPDGGAGAMLGQGWERAGKAATRSQEILDILYEYVVPPATEDPQ